MQSNEVSSFFLAEVKMPSGNVDKPIIEDNRDGTVSIKYGPKEEGLHELHIKYDGEHVQGEFGQFLAWFRVHTCCAYIPRNDSHPRALLLAGFHTYCIEI